MCNKFNHQDAEELRLDIKRILKCSQLPKSKLSKAEHKAYTRVKKGQKQNHTNSKQVAMVVMDKQDYINKAENLIGEPIYRPIPTDPIKSTRLN